MVTAPNTAVTWTGGAAQTVTWDVAGTTAAPVSCATVNIRLSLDGGLTYPTVLATSVPNNGSAVVVAPSPTTASTQARIMVEAADNYFFDISNANFTISPPAPGSHHHQLHAHGRAGRHGGHHPRLQLHRCHGGGLQRHGGGQLHRDFGYADYGHGGRGYHHGRHHHYRALGTATSATSFVVGLPPVITSFTPTSGAVGTVVPSRVPTSRGYARDLQRHHRPHVHR